MRKNFFIVAAAAAILLSGCASKKDIENTLRDADELMSKYRISGVPITEGRRLVGIITNRDLKFETDYSKKIRECMTSENLITAKEGITLEGAKEILAASRKSCSSSIW